LLETTDFQALPGFGVTAKIQQQMVMVGSRGMLTEQAIAWPNNSSQKFEDLETQGQTVIPVAVDGCVAGLITLADVPRPEARAAIAQLKDLGIEQVVMITGDNQHAAEQIGRQLGIDRVYAQVLPQDKLRILRGLQAEGKKVAFAGDGVNDAPAMAMSTVGIAMGAAGTDTALETADVALMADDLTKLTYTIKLSRKTLGIIKQNIAFALIVKGLILLLVVPGWLTLWLAVAGDMGSSLLVTLNGMRLLRMKHED
jgi:Cd2+/Zn2+-exporting ATPase